MENRLAIQPIGHVKEEVITFLKWNLRDSLGAEVEILPPLENPDYAHDSHRKQHHSTRILHRLKAHKPKEYSRILGIVDADLFVPNLNFVFGEADPLSGTALVSLTRLREEFYGNKADEKIFLQRSLKEAVHELGHTFGLEHCIDPECAMFFSNSLNDTDKKSHKFCKSCAEAKKS